MQVVTQDGAGTLHTTYLQCKVKHRKDGGVRGSLGSHPQPLTASHSLQNVNELNQWLSALRKASAPNPDKLASCHPGAFRSARWTCCLQAERSGEGPGRLRLRPPQLSISGGHPSPPYPSPTPATSVWLCNLGLVT